MAYLSEPLLAGLSLVGMLSSGWTTGQEPDGREVKSVRIEIRPAPEPAEFESDAVSQSLLHQDHTLREASFAAVVESARTNSELYAWLCRMADDPAPTELAWTCRLALREIRRAELQQPSSGWNSAAIVPQGTTASVGPSAPGSVWLHGNRDLPSAAPQDPGSAPELALFGGFGDRALVIPFANLPPGVGPIMWWSSSQAAPFDGQRSRTLRPAGVTLQVRQSEGGRLIEREFSAETFQALLERHPELGRRFDIAGVVKTKVSANAQAGRVTPTVGLVSVPFDPSRLGVYVQVDQGGAGLRIYDVVPGGLAQLLGLARGDLLLQLNGVHLRENEDISRVLGSRAENMPVRAVWQRAGGRLESATWQP